MDLPETHLEALVFTYSVTAASSLWTWLAFLTATAVGYWRIRSVASKSDATPTLAPAKNPRPGDDQPQAQPHAQIPAQSAPAAVPCEPSLASGEGQNPVEWRRKGTFFEAHDCHVEDNGGWDGEEMAVEENVWEGDGVLDVIYGGCWGSGVRRRRDLGWYRYQDLTALNGNVVRLWDEDRRLASSPLRISSRLVV